MAFPELDLVFCMDCTGSMGSYIRSAQDNIREISERIVKAEKASVRFALVAYRDHPPQDRTFVTKVFGWTSAVGDMANNLKTLSASGGGDGPEAVADALRDAASMKYRDGATKIVVFISDAPPHGVGSSGDGFAGGCPKKHDPIVIANEMAEKGIVIYSVACEPALSNFANARDFFAGISVITGGKLLPLANASDLADLIIGGASEEISLNRAMQDLETEMKSSKDESEEEIARRVAEALKEKGVKTHKVRADDVYGDFDQTNVDIFVESETLPEARNKLKAINHAAPSASRKVKAPKKKAPKKKKAPPKKKTAAKNKKRKRAVTYASAVAKRKKTGASPKPKKKVVKVTKRVVPKLKKKKKEDEGPKTKELRYLEIEARRFVEGPEGSHRKLRGKTMSDFGWDRAAGFLRDPDLESDSDEDDMEDAEEVDTEDDSEDEEKEEKPRRGAKRGAKRKAEEPPALLKKTSSITLERDTIIEMEQVRRMLRRKRAAEGRG